MTVVEILTGLALYSRILGSRWLNLFIGWLPRLIDVQWLRLTHFLIMFGFWMFFIHHLYSAILVSVEEENGVMESIFSGYKFVPEHELQEALAEEGAKDVQPQPDVNRANPLGSQSSRSRERDMEDLLSADTVVIGVGNTILSDEGVGVHAARMLQSDPRVSAGVKVLDGGTIGLELVPYALGASRVLLLDAMNSGNAPGTLARMTAGDLLATKRGWSAHQLGVADLIAALALVSTRPQEIVLLGVQPSNTDWGTSLSPDVEAAPSAYSVPLCSHPLN